MYMNNLLVRILVTTVIFWLINKLTKRYCGIDIPEVVSWILFFIFLTIIVIFDKRDYVVFFTILVVGMISTAVITLFLDIISNFEKE